MVEIKFTDQEVKDIIEALRLASNQQGRVFATLESQRMDVLSSKIKQIFKKSKE